MPEQVIYGFPRTSFDPSTLPDFDTEFIDKADIDEFAKALNAPETSPVVALNDWRPVHQKVKRKRARPRKRPRRTTDETREGFVYSILKWPLLLVVSSWILLLTCFYLITRLYIYGYERLVTWRGQRQRLRHILRSKTNYQDWRLAAKELDNHLGNEHWKQTDEYALYEFLSLSYFECRDISWKCLLLRRVLEFTCLPQKRNTDPEIVKLRYSCPNWTGT